ncbi:MAG: endonuclease/exonuclease/phosphatase family protein [Bacteroidales bacterium]|nr:endonuclease/exonuclease/phosphatase family protein [Bacteroidales bacterium]
MIKRILYIINLIFALFLLLTYASAFVPPHIAPKFSILTFFYPILLFINISFIIFWLFTKWRYIIIPLIIILIRVDYIPTLFGMSSQKHRPPIENTDIKLLSYNVCSFHYNTEWNESKDKKIDSIFTYIKELNPSIISFQDYHSKRDKKSFHNRLVNTLGFKYYYTPRYNKYNISGNIIYSKYPIIQSGVLFPTKEASNSYIYSDIQINEQTTIRVINLHLTSYQLQDQDKEVFSKLKGGEIDPNMNEKTKPILQKLIWANSKRSYEVEELEPVINKSNMPTIVMGDFNDTPFSYTYKKLSKKLCDAFVAKGQGFGTTYNGDVPAYRIDYILYDKEYFKVKSFEREILEYSDHYPISTMLSLNLPKK